MAAFWGDHALCCSLNLDSLEAVKSCRAGDLIKQQRGRRDVLRLHLAAADGSTRVYYLKRNFRANRKNALRSLLRRGVVWSELRTEWENYRTLASAGFLTPDCIAGGEKCSRTEELFSFLLTREIDGVSLDEFLRTSRGAHERRRTLVELAGVVRRLHDAGLSFPDLYARHIFFRRADRAVVLMDVARLVVRRRLGRRAIARDLAALNVSLGPRFVSARERVHFWHAYSRADDRKLWRAIERRARYLLRQRRFREFHGDVSPVHAPAPTFAQAFRSVFTSRGVATIATLLLVAVGAAIIDPYQTVQTLRTRFGATPVVSPEIDPDAIPDEIDEPERLYIDEVES